LHKVHNARSHVRAVRRHDFVRWGVEYDTSPTWRELAHVGGCSVWAEWGLRTQSAVSWCGAFRRAERRAPPLGAIALIAGRSTNRWRVSR